MRRRRESMEQTPILNPLMRRHPLATGEKSSSCREGDNLQISNSLERDKNKNTEKCDNNYNDWNRKRIEANTSDAIPSYT